jgi:hypothetical protein
VVRHYKDLILHSATKLASKSLKLKKVGDLYTIPSRYSLKTYKIVVFFFKSKRYIEILESIKEWHIRIFGSSLQYANGLVFLLFIDACLTDDEPL